MATSAVDIQQLAINTIRTLSMDAVQAANSGHPGTPMALAPVTYALWTRHLKYDPKHPNWLARDRFVLSCGHASMLLYSILHLAGVEGENGGPSVSIEDIKNFRQLHSPCAGHPEFGEAAGIETTTGPLGQGVANSVGMAISSKWLSARFGRNQSQLCDYDVYALCSDGDIMEGVACEAASLAGHLQLSNLCWIYDDNQITIEGRTELAFSENVEQRFTGLGWNVVTVSDANDVNAISGAFDSFKSHSAGPTLIVLKSIIGYGAPNKQDTASAHGSPLGEEEITLAKENYGWEFDKFLVPNEIYTHFSETLGSRGQSEYSAWQKDWQELESADPVAAEQLKLIQSGDLPKDWDTSLPKFDADEKGTATRGSSGKVLNAVASQIPWLIGGSADLAGSNKSLINDENAGHFAAGQYGGRNFHFGIREHAMAAICNGMSLSGIRPYCATFFVFTDYLRPSMRLSGLMHQPVLYILTHDSIGLGEDGPTHQPVEHLAACRAIPNLLVMRPADANEVSGCYAAAIAETKRPTAMVLTRQNVPTMNPDGVVDGAGKGGYVVQPVEDPRLILIGTGSELSLCVSAAKILQDEGIATQVVSMPCWELFDEQSIEYRNSVLQPNVPLRIAVEAGIKQGWEKYLGEQGHFIGMNGFGASAPFETLYEHFGITTQKIVESGRKMVSET